MSKTDRRDMAEDQPATNILLLPVEAARYLRLPGKRPDQYLLTLARQGRIPSVRIGRYVRFRQEALDEWAREGGEKPRGMTATPARPRTEPRP